MLYTGLFKRIIPFVLTFAVGLFIASFFVSIALPSFDVKRDGHRGRRFHDRQQLIKEIDRLNEELREAKLENETLRQNSWDRGIELTVPPVLDEHHPPPPPKRPKQPRFER